MVDPNWEIHKTVANLLSEADSVKKITRRAKESLRHILHVNNKFEKLNRTQDFEKIGNGRRSQKEKEEEDLLKRADGNGTVSPLMHYSVEGEQEEELEDNVEEKDDPNYREETEEETE